ncbi:MAG: class I SAM-dependent methyltransferase [Pyrinomonadaceae bacterium]
MSSLLAELLPPNASVLDVGCGDGRIASLIGTRRPDLTIQGIDIHVRDSALVPVSEFDGEKIPFDEKSFDVVMFVDVLHHTHDPLVLLREAARVSRHSILLKDHNDNGIFSNMTLRMMDWVGNSPHGVALPYNYWKRQAWDAAFVEVGFEPRVKIEKLGLYPALIDKFCGRQLHFIASLSVPSTSTK